MEEQIPIFLIITSDDDGLSVETEAREIQSALRPLKLKGILDFDIISNSNSSSLTDTLTEYQRVNQTITFLHYAGHASNELLMLDDTNIYGEGLAQQLKGLKIVFLNGCETIQQAEYLQEQGIEAVIVTNVPIHDSQALIFAKTFYEQLAAHRTLREAFEFASAQLMTLYGSNKLEQKNKGLKLKRKKEEQYWELLYQNHRILNWKIQKNNTKHTFNKYFGQLNKQYSLLIILSIFTLLGSLYTINLFDIRNKNTETTHPSNDTSIVVISKDTVINPSNTAVIEDNEEKPKPNNNIAKNTSKSTIRKQPKPIPPKETFKILKGNQELINLMERKLDMKHAKRQANYIISFDYTGEIVETRPGSNLYYYQGGFLVIKLDDEVCQTSNFVIRRTPTFGNSLGGVQKNVEDQLRNTLNKNTEAIAEIIGNCL